MIRCEVCFTEQLKGFNARFLEGYVLKDVVRGDGIHESIQPCVEVGSYSICSVVLPVIELVHYPYLVLSIRCLAAVRW